MSVAKKSFVIATSLLEWKTKFPPIIPVNINKQKISKGGANSGLASKYTDPLRNHRYFAILTINQYIPAASNPLTGMVISQARIISSATLQRTLLARSAEPTPMIAELTTWEALTGTPNREAARITPAELNWVEKLSRGRIL